MASLRQRFKQFQDVHPNPLTPKIVRLERADNKVIELSKSRRKEFYGVAAWEDTGETCEFCNEDRDEHNHFENFSHDLATSFHDKEDAETYVHTLKKKIKNYEEVKDIVEEVEEE